jgi:hypothetical protein
MIDLRNFPFLLLIFFLVALWLSARLGANLHARHQRVEVDEHAEFDLILGATLTLLGLIIGFSFSMAVSRYDQRKNYEEAEANAIGTEYVRADLLPTAAARVRNLLTRYAEQRVLFYQTRDEHRLRQVDLQTVQLQDDLWSAIASPALAQPNPVTALAVSGMNDVLNSQGYTQAAWWNRIPGEAWALMTIIAMGSHFLLGYRVRRAGAKGIVFLTLPLVVSVAFWLIADIDSPRSGMIRISPQNLLSLLHSLH